jgi:hypothetical protein
MSVYTCKTCGGTGTVVKERFSDFDCLLKRFDDFQTETKRRLEALEPQVMFVYKDGKPVRRASEQEIETIRQSKATARALKKQQDIPFGFGVYQASTENEELRRKYNTVVTERDALQSKLEDIKKALGGYTSASIIRSILARK